jgi:hypothetical protein
MCNLHFSYGPTNIIRPMRMYSDIRHQRMQSVVWILFQQLFMLTSKQPFRTQWQSVARLWSKNISFPFKTELVAENTILGTQEAAWKERLWGKWVLEENIRTVISTTGGNLRLLCVVNFILSSERQAGGTVLRLPARKCYWCRLHFFSACLFRMYCSIIGDHTRMWVITRPLQCTILQCTA